jgi:hypothetical protein
LRLRDYFWFCKHHVREYNAAWDYCQGMGQAEIDHMVRQDAVWDRPTWPLGLQRLDSRSGVAFKGEAGLFDEEGLAPSQESSRPLAAEGSELWAMQILELRSPLTLTDLKVRYKELAKQLHPDLNGGDAQAEEQLKRINLAYATLRTRLTSQAGSG